MGEHVRYRQLCQVSTQAANEVARAMLNEHVNTCFPTIVQMKGGREVLARAVAESQAYFSKTCQRQFARDFEDQDLELLLNELDDLVEEAQQRRARGGEPIFIDRFTPAQMLEAALAPNHKGTAERLQMILAQLEGDNLRLCTELKEMARESERIKDGIQELLEALAVDEGAGSFYGKLDRLADAAAWLPGE